MQLGLFLFSAKKDLHFSASGYFTFEFATLAEEHEEKACGKEWKKKIQGNVPQLHLIMIETLRSAYAMRNK